MIVRYVVYGAGAVGGIIAARLHGAGRQVALIARGATRQSIQDKGLWLLDEQTASCHHVPVFGHPREVDWRAGDAVILAMKSQDTQVAVQDLAAAAPADVHIFCAQNGVENERMAQRMFAHVHGMFVFVFGASLRPGEVRCFTAPSAGVVDLGRYPSGSGEPAIEVARDLCSAGFESEARTDIFAWKYAKLLANLGNALTASYGDSSAVPDLLWAVQEEGRACFHAAGHSFVSLETMLARRAHLLPLKTVAGEKFPGSSSWQSLARGSASTEADYLTGEIVLMGRLHGVATPLNEALQAQVRAMALERTKPGTLDPADLRSRFGLRKILA